MAEATLDQSRSKPLSDNQIGMIFSDIANCASSIKRFAIAICQEGDRRDHEAHRQGIECLAERIGLLADRAADVTPDSLGAVVGVEPEDWMMPPLYFDDVRQEANHG